jgi:hypothetical protein
MRLCDNGHDEVCYDGRDCPVCALREEINRLLDEIQKLKDELAEM